MKAVETFRIAIDKHGNIIGQVVEGPLTLPAGYVRLLVRDGYVDLPESELTIQELNAT